MSARSWAGKTKEFFGTAGATATSVLGIDPDLHSTSWAIVREGVVVAVGIARVPKDTKGQQCCVEVFRQLQLRIHHWPFQLALIEGQTVYQAQGAETKNPKSLVDLAAVAGAAASAASLGDSCYGTLVVPPSVWKGTLPKHIPQTRACRKLGWDYALKGGKKPYAVPSKQRWPYHEGPLNPGDWKHLMDAVALALWGWEKAAAAA